ncbi:hypothetical protein [Noviluteimonas gilva]|uniref:Uncharacterized protein n=1 Tax=Noviluteimonas gilva TaxID=2682097 RepID=A0A7C9HYN4_9GAMM|nr:hypothetical protein [Lysobacter gilvus]MUV14254.1 hypothetical protein [Lysobacter gilvus]
MNTRDDNALTPEERALAQRLAKIGPQGGEPSPSLDARILAMAHAAASAPVEDVAPARVTTLRKRKPQTWVTTVGFAASLAIACGIAWNLREMPDAPPPEPVAAQAPEEEAVEYQPPPPPSMSARVVPRRPLNMPAPPPEPVVTQPRSTSRAAARAKVEPKPQPFEAAPIVLDEAVHPVAPGAINPIDVTSVESTTVFSAEQLAKLPKARTITAPPMAAPAAAPAPAAPTRDQFQRAADASLERRRQANEADAAAKAARAEEPAFAESDEEVVPPATANDPAVRDAWLLRIRELVRDGKLDQARESLHAFRARYPGQPLPEDLRALGE